MARRIQIRRDLSTVWSQVNPLLAQGEPGLETDTGKVKYGNGVNYWNDLPYTGGGDTGKIIFDRSALGAISTINNGTIGAYGLELAPNGGDGDSTSNVYIPNNTDTDNGASLQLNAGLGGVIMTTPRGDVLFGADMEAPGAPNHFHIAFFNSNNVPPSAELYLGDDYNNVQILGNDQGVKINSNNRGGESGQKTWTFGTDGTTTFPSGETGNLFIQGPEIGSQTDVAITASNRILLSTNASESFTQWEFGTDGSLKLPVGGDIKDSDGNSVLGGGTEADTLDSVTSRGSTTTNSITVGGVTSNTLTSGLGVATGSTATSSGFVSYGGQNIQLDQSNFTSGTLSSIQVGWTVHDDSGFIGTITVINYYGNPGLLRLDDGQSFSPTNNYFYSPDYAPAAPSDLTLTADTNNWVFGAGGSLTIPGTVVSTNHLNLDADYDAGYSVYIGNEHPTAGMLGGVVLGDTRGGFINVKTTKFIIGDTAVPTHSTGSAGDVKGQIAFDSSYIYYCTANYDGVANIWKRVAWSNDTW